MEYEAHLYTLKTWHKQQQQQSTWQTAKVVRAAANTDSHFNNCGGGAAW